MKLARAFSNKRIYSVSVGWVKSPKNEEREKKTKMSPCQTHFSPISFFGNRVGFQLRKDIQQTISPPCAIAGASGHWTSKVALFGWMMGAQVHLIYFFQEKLRFRNRFAQNILIIVYLKRAAFNSFWLNKAQALKQQQYILHYIACAVCPVWTIFVLLTQDARAATQDFRMNKYINCTHAMWKWTRCACN